MKTCLTTLVAIALSAAPLRAEDLALTIQPPKEPIQVGDYPKFLVTVTNRGKLPVTLVEPGDGSDCKWRTPVVGWSAIHAGDFQGKHPDETPVYRGARCGNVNSLKLSEVFTLKPGETHALGEWTGAATFPRPGKYHVLYYYENIPALPVLGLSGGHDPGVVEKIQQSTPCRLRSNELIVEVLPKNE